MQFHVALLACFSGTQHYYIEMEASKLHTLGYNASFNPGGGTFPTSGTNPCAPDISSNNFGVFNATQFQRAIWIANYYALWLVLDYHSYSDMNSTYRTCWLNSWRSIVRQFKNSYAFLIWQPLNEPKDLGGGSTWANVNLLGDGYNAWISQARSLGDSHYVVVENLCSYGCNYNVENYWRGYPGADNNSRAISDPYNRVYMSLHAGMGWNYDYPVHWNGCQISCPEQKVYQYYNYTTADQFARYFYLSMRNGTAKTGWTILNTEGSAIPHCGVVQACLNLESSSGLTGSAGYANVTLRFIQTLTNYLSNNSPRYGWVWFPMAEWPADGTVGAGTYGALSPNNGWGTKLGFTGVCVLSTSGGAYTADRNGDGTVNIVDLALVAGHFGAGVGDPNYDPRADVNLDGVANIVDLVLVAGRFGSVC